MPSTRQPNTGVVNREDTGLSGDPVHRFRVLSVRQPTAEGYRPEIQNDDLKVLLQLGRILKFCFLVRESARFQGAGLRRTPRPFHFRLRHSEPIITSVNRDFPHAVMWCDSKHNPWPGCVWSFAWRRLNDAEVISTQLLQSQKHRCRRRAEQMGNCRKRTSRHQGVRATIPAAIRTTSDP